MHILITGAAGRLAQAVADELGRDHRVRLMDRVPIQPADKMDFFQGDLLDPRDVWQAVRGIDTVIHTATPPPDLPASGLARDQALLDLGTRGTHVLLSAAVQAGVRRCIYAGTLRLFDAYPDDVYITENYKPLPPLDMESMSNYLGELGCREFTYAHPLTGTSLRLGTLVLEEETEGLAPDPSWLDRRDAARAFRCALHRDAGEQMVAAQRWQVYHVCAAVSNPRFLLHAARQLGYAPEHNFQRPLSRAS